MSKSEPFIYTILLTCLLGLLPSLSFAQVFKQITVVAPASPITAANDLNIYTTVTPDQNQEIWVTYNLFAVSDQDKPAGKIVLESMPELTKTPMSDTVVTFNANDMTSVKSKSGKFKQMFEKQAGNRTEKELVDTFGPDLTKVILALKENKGAMLTQNITKHFPAPNKNNLVLLTSIEKVEGIQPALITITVGQGDIPEQYKKDFLGETSSVSHNKTSIIALIILLIAGFFVFKKLRE